MYHWNIFKFVVKKVHNQSHDKIRINNDTCWSYIVHFFAHWLKRIFAKISKGGSAVFASPWQAEITDDRVLNLGKFWFKSGAMWGNNKQMSILSINRTFDGGSRYSDLALDAFPMAPIKPGIGDDWFEMCEWMFVTFWLMRLPFFLDASEIHCKCHQLTYEAVNVAKPTLTAYRPRVIL